MAACELRWRYSANPRRKRGIEVAATACRGRATIFPFCAFSANDGRRGKANARDRSWTVCAVVPIAVSVGPGDWARGLPRQEERSRVVHEGHGVSLLSLADVAAVAGVRR